LKEEHNEAKSREKEEHNEAKSREEEYTQGGTREVTHHLYTLPIP